MGDLLEKKTELLSLYYPSYSSEVLRDILEGCGGDIDKAKELIEGPKAHKSFAVVQRTLTPHVKKDASGGSGISKGATEKRKNTEKSGGDSILKRLRPSTDPDKGAANRAKAPQITLNTPEDVEKHIGRWAQLELRFFKDGLADELLTELAEDKHKFKVRQFYLFGNLCTSDLLVSHFKARDNNCPSLVYNGIALEGSDDPKGGPNPYTPRFYKAAEYLENEMNDRIIPSHPRLPLQSTERWTAGFCVANRYEKISNHLDWHSDRLSHIGPHNYIASISLGSTRVFKLRSNVDPNAPIYSIPLPHNSLFIMKPGCQEMLKHALGPMSKSLSLHPEVGPLRISLTFRHYPVDFIKNVPKCRCDLPMLLRRAFKSPKTKGTYFWSCENVYQNKECGTFYWADLNNWKDHFVATSVDTASRWLESD